MGQVPWSQHPCQVPRRFDVNQHPCCGLGQGCWLTSNQQGQQNKKRDQKFCNAQIFAPLIYWDFILHLKPFPSFGRITTACPQGVTINSLSDAECPLAGRHAPGAKPQYLSSICKMCKKCSKQYAKNIPKICQKYLCQVYILHIYAKHARWTQVC